MRLSLSRIASVPRRGERSAAWPVAALTPAAAGFASTLLEASGPVPGGGSGGDGVAAEWVILTARRGRLRAAVPAMHTGDHELANRSADSGSGGTFGSFSGILRTDF